jgi:hypothetical protein
MEQSLLERVTLYLRQQAKHGQHEWLNPHQVCCLLWMRNDSYATNTDQPFPL